MPDTSGHGGQHSADPPNRPSSARTGVRHAAGMASAITPESCPSWAGVRNLASVYRRTPIFKHTLLSHSRCGDQTHATNQSVRKVSIDTTPAAPVTCALARRSQGDRRCVVRLAHALRRTAIVAAADRQITANGPLAPRRALVVLLGSRSRSSRAWQLYILSRPMLLTIACH
jgi:hypothetical protein